MAIEMNFTKFKDHVSRELNLHLDSYKLDRVERRILSLMRRHQIDSYNECYHKICRDPNFKEAFINHFTINTSEFFRNPSSFAFLKEHVLPLLFQQKKKVHIWSAACSFGAEPYSVAILLEEQGVKPHSYKLVATDLDRSILEAAKEGLYNSQALLRMEKELIDKYFIVQGEDAFQVNPTIRSLVSFQYQDLLKDSFTTGWDLIICRNFFIYLTKEGKDTLTHRFVKTLNTGGILFLGNTEFIFDPPRYNLEKLHSSFYKKLS